jgi:multiple sugar transport system permease protein
MEVKLSTLAILMLGALIALPYLIPFYWMVLASFRDAATAQEPLLAPVVQTVENYVVVLNTQGFLRWYFNSLVISILTTLISVTISAISGYAFARLDFPMRDKLFLLLLGTLMIPFPITIVPNFILILKLGWVNTYQGIIVPTLAYVVGVFLMREFFKTIPYEVEEAAVLDGATPWDIFFRIMIPLARPALSAVAIYTFVSAWNNFLWPLIVAQTSDMFTVPVGLNFFKTANGQAIEWNYLMAGTTLSIIPTIVIYAVFQRYFIRGIAFTGVKR